MSSNLSKLTTRYSKVLEYSKDRAFSLGKKQIDIEDLFCSLVEFKGSVAHEILNKSGFSKQNKKITLPPAQQKTQPQDVNFSEQTRRVIQKSVVAAADNQHNYVGTEHLLFALIDSRDKQIDKLLNEHQVRKEKILDQLKIVFASSSNFSEMSQVVNKVGKMVALPEMLELLNNSKKSLTPEERIELEELAQQDSEIIQAGILDDSDFEKMPAHRVSTITRNAKRNKKKLSLLEHFGNNLTDERVQKNIDPVIGREKEIKRIVQILCRRTKNNPVLLGEPGVGKTAIVEGLAKKIVHGQVPDILLDKKIYSLDMNMMVAGAMMRGEFEARLKQVIDEVQDNPDIILFIDELHNVVGAGNMQGTMDAANILKPALARGELRCIGATTFTEYKKHIEEDPALERRFQAVQVPEPSLAETVKILAGIRENYENHHLVKITDESINAAAILSDRYLPEKFLPDKAIDLIDEAAAKIKVDSGVVDEDLRQLKFIESKLQDLEEQKLNLVNQEKYDEALKLKEKENNLYNSIFALEDKISIKREEQKWLGKVTARSVAEVVSLMTGVPLTNLIGWSKGRLINLERLMSQKIVGQNEVLKQLAFYLKRARAGLSGSNRPLGSFLFLGPSGVGKTETAKILATEIFGTHDKVGNLIRLDMSEFAEGFNVSRLIGSPAGYVGFKEGGRLTEAVRRNPYSVVLFDEVEKAHPEVFNILLQILDDGILTDATGKKVNFKNTVIILTSNLGLSEMYGSDIGFEGKGNKVVNFAQEKMNNILKETFRPEFLNRLDKTIIFKPLASKSIEKIVELQLNELAAKLRTKKINLTWEQSVIINLAKLSYSSESGARNVRRTIEDKIENQLAERVLGGKIKSNQEVNLGFSNKGVVIQVKERRN